MTESKTREENGDNLEDEDDEEEDDMEAGPSSTKKNPRFNHPAAGGEEGDSSNSSFADDDDSDDDSFDDSDESDEAGEHEGGEGEDGVQEEEEEVAEEDGEDPLITQLKKAKEKPERKAPPDIKLRDEIMDLSFHPLSPLIAVSTINGDIQLFEYSNEANKIKKTFKIHKKDVRSIEFDRDGKCLYSASQDKSLRIIDMESSSVKYKVLNAHDAALYRVRPIDQHVCATGDEDGTTKLWDYRQAKSVMETKSFDDFVSDFFVDDECKIMVASSGEGTLQSYNLRGRRPDMQSEVYEGELNCLGRVHHASKLVAGCGDGRLYMFNWNQFAYHSADFPGHPDAINDLVAVTDNVVVTACEDGTIRAVHLYPHRFIGVVGHHEGGFGIERLDISSEGDVVASISHDQKVKFWNIKYMEEMDYKKTAKPFDNRKKYKIRRKENRIQTAKEREHQLPSSNRGNTKDFFAGLAE